MTKKALVCVLVLAAVGGAYFLGTRSNATPPAEAPAADTAVKPPIVEDGLIVPVGLTTPATVPPIKIDEPAKVLAGEIKVPNDLLRTEPPRNPALIIPTIPADKK